MFLKFLDTNVSYIELNGENEELFHPIPLTSSKNETIKLYINANPNVTRVEWKNNRNITINNDTKYELFWNSSVTLLTIFNVSIEDFGQYSVLASNGITEKIIHLQFFIHGKYYNDTLF